MSLTQNYIAETPPIKNKAEHAVRKTLRIVFYALLVLYVITYFTKDNYKGVEGIMPEVLKAPVQKPVIGQQPFEFVRDDYQYDVTPLYNYELNALVVHKYDYTRLKIYKLESVFPMDLCVLWGKNVGDKIYQDSTVKFSQDGRFCRYQGMVEIHGNEISNNHLVINDKALERKINSLSHGDQIKIVGKLVNISAKNIGKPVSQYDYESFNWGTSTTREDSGAGACETIYVEDVQILKKANPISYYINLASYYSLIIVMAIRLILFFKGMRGPKDAPLPPELPKLPINVGK